MASNVHMEGCITKERGDLRARCKSFMYLFLQVETDYIRHPHGRLLIQAQASVTAAVNGRLLRQHNLSIMI